ncbi:hypothetical protein C8F04DRAFT_489030 [Mycena alexandri]|uniref:Uncharacterized protein n=1 Tax=Mycena alexandri TaxID=1745969 RepID=A0AAD6T0F7_9AGAR|nr:hypothetical protein C8F04DRAFT_489030 [Mycena alexandri]
MRPATRLDRNHRDRQFNTVPTLSKRNYSSRSLYTCCSATRIPRQQGSDVSGWLPTAQDSSARPSPPCPSCSRYPNRPQSAVEEGERIRGFWAVACLQSSLDIELCDWKSRITPRDVSRRPFEGRRLSRTLSSRTLLRLVHCPHFARKYSFTVLHNLVQSGSRDAASYTSSASWLEGHITQFGDRLPPLYNFYAHPVAARILVVTHALTAPPRSGCTTPLPLLISRRRKRLFLQQARSFACLGDSNVADFTRRIQLWGRCACSRVAS